MMSVSSANGMKSTGASSPRSGCSRSRQRFEAGDATGAEVDQRLVERHDLASVDGVGQRGRRGAAGHGTAPAAPEHLQLVLDDGRHGHEAGHLFRRHPVRSGVEQAQRSDHDTLAACDRNADICPDARREREAVLDVPHRGRPAAAHDCVAHRARPRDGVEGCSDGCHGVLHVGVEDVDDASGEAEAFGGQRDGVMQRRVRCGQTQIVRRRRVLAALLVGSHSSPVARAAQKHLTRPDVSTR